MEKHDCQGQLARHLVMVLMVLYDQLVMLMLMLMLLYDQLFLCW